MKLSEQVDKLFPALYAAMDMVRDVQLSATNPAFGSNYAPLEEVIGAIKPALRECDLFMTTETGPVRVISDVDKVETLWVNKQKTLVPAKVGVGVASISVLIGHISGQYIIYEGDVLFEIEGQNPTHKWGGAQTYGRRYVDTGIFNLVPETDIDGNTEQQQAEPKKPAPPKPAPEFKTYKEWETHFNSSEDGDLHVADVLVAAKKLSYGFDHTDRLGTVQDWADKEYGDNSKKLGSDTPLRKETALAMLKALRDKDNKK